MLVGASAVTAALVAPAMGVLPLYHCQVAAGLVRFIDGVRIGQRGHDVHTHLGLQRGQGHRARIPPRWQP